MQTDKSKEDIDWDQCGDKVITINDVIDFQNIKKSKNSISSLKLFHNCKFNDILAYSKLGKLVPRTESDNKKHVFCSYGKCWFEPKVTNDENLYDLPFTFVFETDTLLNKAIRALVFDGGFVHDLHNKDSVFSFLNGFDYGNFKIEPSIKYVNKFIEALYGNYSNYYSGYGLKFNSEKMILENPNPQFKNLFTNSESILNKVAWIVTQTQKGDRRRVSTIEFFFKEIEPRKMNIWELHVHPRIIEGQEEFSDFKQLINIYGYKKTKKAAEYSNENLDDKKLYLREGTAFEMVTNGSLSEWGTHLKHVNEHYANNWI